ncbi:MAG: DUF2723 domain-containing protein [Chloroflexi bacterium]|nr:DUF2723 domain-containing protein [Chloroflexota bacterium]
MSAEQQVTGGHTRRRHLLVAAGLGLASFAVYFRTLAPTVSLGDSAEFATAAYFLGIPHPTGYPLYMLLSKLFIVALPFGDVAYRVNLLSAVFAALSVGVLYLLIIAMTSRPWVAVVSVLSVAFAHSFWSKAVVADVYSLHAFFMVMSLLVVWQWRQTGEKKYLYILSAVLGLSLAHHGLTLLIIPALVYGVVALGPFRKLRLGHALFMSAVVLLGLSFYLYLPLRYAQNPPMNFAAMIDVDLTTFKGFTGFVSGRIFRTELTSFTTETVGSQMSLALASAFADYLVVGAFLVVFGAYAHYKRDRRGFLFLLLVFLPNLLFISAYRIRDISDYFMFVALPLSVWLAEGMGLLSDALVGFAGRRTETGGEAGRPFSLVLLLFLPLALFLYNFGDVDRSGYRVAKDYCDENLSAVPREAVILTRFPASNLWYCHLVDGLRPDVTVVDPGLATLRAREFSVPRGASTEEHIEIVARAELSVVDEYASRPLFVVKYDSVLATRWAFEVYGELYRLLDKGMPLVERTPEEASEVRLPIFDGSLRLVKVSLEPREVKAGDLLRVVLSWRATKVPEVDPFLTFSFRRRYEGEYRSISSSYQMKQGYYLLGPTRWPEGSVVVEYYDLLVLYEAEPGSYALDLTLVGDGVVLPVVAGTSERVSTGVRLGEFRILE